MHANIRVVGTTPYPPGVLTVWIPQLHRLLPWERNRWLPQVLSRHRQQASPNRLSPLSKYSNLPNRPHRSHLLSHRKERMQLTTCPFSIT